MLKYDIVLEDHESGYSLRATESNFYIQHVNEEEPAGRFKSHYSATCHYYALTGEDGKLVDIMAAKVGS